MISLDAIKLLKPIEIKNFLDQYVIGQDMAKKYFRLLFIITIKG